MSIFSQGLDENGILKNQLELTEIANRHLKVELAEAEAQLAESKAHYENIWQQKESIRAELAEYWKALGPIDKVEVHKAIADLQIIKSPMYAWTVATKVLANRRKALMGAGCVRTELIAARDKSDGSYIACYDELTKEK